MAERDGCAACVLGISWEVGNSAEGMGKDEPGSGSPGVSFGEIFELLLFLVGLLNDVSVAIRAFLVAWFRSRVCVRFFSLPCLL